MAMTLDAVVSSTSGNCSSGSMMSELILTATVDINKQPMSCDAQLQHQIWKENCPRELSGCEMSERANCLVQKKKEKIR